MIGSGGLKSNACWSGSRNLSCSTSRVPSRASASNLTSSSSVSLRRFRSLAASLILLNEKSCNELRDAVRRYSIETWLGTHHPLESIGAKKSLRRWPLKGGCIFTQNFSQSVPLSTLPLAILSTRPTWVGAPNPMGVEREHIGARILAANKELIDLLRSLIPLSESATVDELLTHIRLRIAAGDLSVVPHFYKAVLREHCEQNGLAEKLSQVAGSEVAPKTASGGSTGTTEITRRAVGCTAADKSVEYPDAALPQKAVRRRAEKSA